MSEALAGAEVIVNLSASPYLAGYDARRERMLVQRAVDYLAAGVFVNTVGGQDELVFDGHSLAIDQDGQVLARAPQFEEALTLWRGPPLADFAYEAFAQEEIARLEELRLAATELRVDAELASGQHAGLIGELETLVKRHPFRERLRAQLILAFYRSGRQTESQLGHGAVLAIGVG